MDGTEGTLHHSSEFGKVGTHPVAETAPLLVAPTTGDLFNTLSLDLIPVACMSLHDVLFEFDSSFVKQSVSTLLTELPPLRESHKNKNGEFPRLSVFGHADPVGEDEYNKLLSGRRAVAVYGVLTHSLTLWKFLLNTPMPTGGDNWRTAKVPAKMREVVGPGPKTEDQLIEAYLAALCPFQLQRSDFLGDGADDHLKADVQGCGEFNPLLLLSQDENKTLAKAERNDENQPNRRVVIFLFRAGVKVNPKLWPCPTAAEPTAKCRPRFFGPPKTGDQRREAGEARREHVATPSPDVDAPDDTFACRFYFRIAHLSPCEGKIVPVFRTLHVFIKLAYKDPEGNARDFPPEFPVTVEFAKGDSFDIKTTDGGLLDFEVDRDKRQFTLRFDSPQAQYLAAADKDTKGPGPERLIAEGDLAGAVADHYRVFRLPLKWSLSDSDWAVPAASFSDSFFRNLDDLSVTIGSKDAPVKMLLDPHWQFLRFVYFDRKLGKKLSIPQILMEGFLKSTAASGALDTHANWTVQPDALVQCLPWILRQPPKPDKDVLIQFKTDDDTFIETKADKSRQLVSGTKHDVPKAERLQFYDLPKLWKSSHYFARLTDDSSVPKEGDGTFEKVADKPTTLAKPMIFSLDDMVLTDAKFHPIAWTAKDRVAIFNHTFADITGSSDVADLGEIGIFASDTDDHETYLTKPPKIDTGGNYIAEYPDWTRLLVVKGNLFDVFDRRTTTGSVIGARAAVRWVDSASLAAPGAPQPRPKATDDGRFFLIQPFFEQSFRSGADNDRRTGRYDIALLRCCDADEDVEVAVTLHYFRYHFNFNPAPDRNFASKGLAPPLKDDKGEQQKWADIAVRTVARRWNNIPEDVGGEFGPGRPQLLPQDPAAHKIRIDMIYFLQSVPRSFAHVSFGVYSDVRANVDSTDGIGSIEASEGAAERTGKPPGRFTLAHETGHVASLGDDYIETRLNASGDFFGIVSDSPGSPYQIAGRDMMINNLDPAPRYYWHAAELLFFHRNVPLIVKQGRFEYKIPHHPGLPLRSFVNHPLVEKLNASADGRGKFDLFLYPLGDEPLSASRLPKLLREMTPPRTPPDQFDGLLVIVLKFKLHAFKNDDKLVRECMVRTSAAIFENFGNTYFAKGTAKAKLFSGDGDVAMSNIFVIIQPRFLVSNFPQDKSLRSDMKTNTEAEYLALVQSLEASPGVHLEIGSQEKGATHWAVKPEPPSAGKPAPRGRLILSHEQMKDKDAFGGIARPFLWDMLGLPDTTDTAVGARQLEKIVKQVMADATVQAYPLVK